LTKVEIKSEKQIYIKTKERLEHGDSTVNTKVVKGIQGNKIKKGENAVLGR